MPFTAPVPPTGPTLSVFIEGAPGSGDRLLQLTRGEGRTVAVREERFGAEAGVHEYAADASDVGRTFEEAVRTRRRLSVELPIILRWLQGAG